MNNSKHLIILGAGGHGKVAADCAEHLACYNQISFLDARYPELSKLESWPVVGQSEENLVLDEGDTEFFVAIGNNAIRQKQQKALKDKGLKIATLIHPSSTIGKGVKIGEGTLVVAGAVINPFSQIGNGVIVNTCASIDHDCQIEDFVHLAPGVRLAGSVKVEALAFMGVASCAIPSVTIGEHTIVGAGATVIDSISAHQVVVGTPAKPTKKTN